MADLHIASYLAPSVFPLYEAVAEALAARLGLDVELTGERSYDSFRADRPDMSFVCSLAWIHYQDLGATSASPIAAPILSGARYGGRPLYFSDVIVSRRSDAGRFLDLRGRTWAYNEPLSQSGYGITRYHLTSLGETGGFFSEVVGAGSHATAIRMVAAGEVDGSAIDSQVLEMALRREPGLRERIRVVDRLGPSTIQPVTLSTRIPPDLRSRIVATLVALHSDSRVAPRLAGSLVDRFVPVGPDTYQDVRRMLDTCRAAGFMELR
jgi:phosphonate transport system substrate-binding protein